MTKEFERLLIKEMRNKTDDELNLIESKLSGLYWIVSDMDITNIILDILQLIYNDQYRRVKNNYPF